jgi:hypothetical protein
MGTLPAPAPVVPLAQLTTGALARYRASWKALLARTETRSCPS